MPGTPLAENPQVDPFDLVRMIACARIAVPTAKVRLSAGRTRLSDEIQALCFYAGANSIFYGEKLLTARKPDGRDGPRAARQTRPRNPGAESRDGGSQARPLPPRQPGLRDGGLLLESDFRSVGVSPASHSTPEHPLSMTSQMVVRASNGI